VINDEFGKLLLTTFNDTSANPVHMLFNQWWQHAPEEVKAAYVAAFERDADLGRLASGAEYAEPLTLQELADLPAGSLGRTYHDWIVDNNLTAAIATNYKQFHEMLAEAGMLDGMPQAMQFAVLRGFQTHDFLHVVTGYDSSGRGEIALQAFCLAQLQFPYFGMWMSVVTTRMTFVDPSMIEPIMDAVTDGWQLGRRTPNIQVIRWEEMLERPLPEVRAELGVVPSALCDPAPAAA
jgi:ubiquinone biosynthesis protein COQ4